jgi:acetyl esterase/lipase
MTLIRLHTGLFLLFISISILSCSKSNPAGSTLQSPATSLPDTSITMLNVAYGPDAKQVMDIYLPNGRHIDTTKVIILIHGGAWIQGDKSDFDIAGLQNLFPGFAVFNINYRLATYNPIINTFPTQELDVKAAVQFIYDHRTYYTISNNWAYLGLSAGGHLALLQAYKYTTPIRPKVVIDFFGPTDMVDIYNAHANDNYLQPILFILLSGTPSTNANLYASSSPIAYANTSSPPTIILQGGQDTLVPYTESQRLHDTLTTLGVVNKYIFYPTQGHGFTGNDLLNSLYETDSFLVNNISK